MLTSPRIPELAQRDRFVRRAAKEGRVFTLADEEAASVPSQKLKGRTVQLFWSSPVEAKRWAEALTGETGLQEIPLPAFASDILPGLKAARGLAGTDWVSDPIEAEVDPADLQLRLKIEAVPYFLARLAAKAEVFLVSGTDGPLIETLERRGGPIEALSVFAIRADADRHMRKIGGARVIADPLSDFQLSTVPWAADRNLMVSIEPIAGAGPVDILASDVMARFQAG